MEYTHAYRSRGLDRQARFDLEEARCLKKALHVNRNIIAKDSDIFRIMLVAPADIPKLRKTVQNLKKTRNIECRCHCDAILDRIQKDCNNYESYFENAAYVLFE